MGRGKLTMERIKSQKARQITFKKRKCGLKKKLDELSTLCGVDVCMIIYPPKEDDFPTDIEVYPADKIETLINKYKNQSTDRRRIQDLSNFFEDRKQKAENEVAKLRQKHEEIKYPRWDNLYNDLSEQNLREFSLVLDRKLEAVKIIVEVMKSNERLVNQNQSCIMQGLFRRNMQLDVFSPECLVRGTPSYPVDQIHQELHFDQSSMVDPMTMVLMKENNWSRFAGESSGNLLFNPMNGSTAYNNYDPMNGMLENMMVNNPVPPMFYYGPAIQPVQQYMQMHYPIMTSSSSQMHATHIEEHNVVYDYDKKDQK